MKAMINGDIVDVDAINHHRYRYVGAHRPVINKPDLSSIGALKCECGKWLHSHGMLIAHYQAGCFDVPEYVDRKGNEPAENVKVEARKEVIDEILAALRDKYETVQIREIVSLLQSMKGKK